MSDLPTVVTAAGLQPQTPAALRAQLLALVSATNPGYTANLPGSMIEDISSTDVGAILIADSARVELVNSLTPNGANVFLLQQLGSIYGVAPGVDTNTSVYLVFTGPPGYVIAKGFTVSDGSYQYVLQDGGIIGSGGITLPLFAVATQSGIWAVPGNTVNQLVTSVPSPVVITVTNPQAGTPSGGAQTEEGYRAQVLQAGLAASMGMARYLKTILANVPGVQPRLISVLQIPGSGYEVICGGGDPYQVAYAIFDALFDITTLIGSVLAVSNITVANPGVVTTVNPHGLTTGNIITISGLVGMGPVNGVPQTITVLTPTTFQIGNTTGYPVYVSGGVISPNPRNISVTITDTPNTYLIPFVNPLVETVSIALLWGTISPNVVSDASISQLGTPALVAYVNSIFAGQPMNLFELQAVFQAAVVSLIPTEQLTRMVFSVSINGVGVSPTAGTGIINGDPEGYFLTTAPQITISRG